jgi:hypothetical protein
MHFCFRRGRDASGGACDRTLQANEGEAAEADYSLRRGTRPKRTNDPPKRTALVGSLLSLLKTSVLSLIAGVFGAGFGGGGSHARLRSPRMNRQPTPSSTP